MRELYGSSPSRKETRQNLLATNLQQLSFPPSSSPGRLNSNSFSLAKAQVEFSRKRFDCSIQTHHMSRARRTLTSAAQPIRPMSAAVRQKRHLRIGENL